MTKLVATTGGGVQILVGLAKIGQQFGAGAKRVRAWERMGAPIVRDPSGVPMAEAGELWAWIKTEPWKTPKKANSRAA